MLADTLLASMFDGQPHLLREPMALWLASSRRFTTFANTFRDKIRKKLRTTHDHEGLLDLRLELETAYALLQERSLHVAYEAQQPGHTRCPDFAVTFTTSLTFMVEVTRLRADRSNGLTVAQEPAAASVQTSTHLGERLADTLCGKLRQLLPQRSNVLIAGVEALHLTQADLQATLLRLQQRAEHNDTTLLRRHGLSDRAAFFHRYRRLSAMIVRGPAIHAGEPVIFWVNPQAKHPLPSKVRTALLRSHTG